MSTHAAEVAQGERFEFGKNWSFFLQHLNDQRIERAVASLREMLQVDTLAGLSFLDIGSGSGLFSLAARKLGARVHSFDFDPNSVACTQELRRRYFPNDPQWTVESGSALDPAYIRSLGTFDIVYSWGVLHHTGRMWEALENATIPTGPKSKLFIAIYNDQGTASRRWKWVKQTYNSLPKPLRFLMVWPSFWVLNWRIVVKDTARLRPLKFFRNYGQARGMNFYRDLIDWVGGLPFEVAKPEEIFNFYRARGFQLITLVTAGGSLGCNEFVFERTASPA